MNCSYCNANLQKNRILEDSEVAPMKNKSRIINPQCLCYGNTILLFDVKDHISEQNKVLLISGTTASGKTSLGQLIEENSNYNKENLERYLSALSTYNIDPFFRVLVPDRKTCIERNNHRECWTADIEWIDKWYDEQRNYLNTHKALCIDTSNESLEETFVAHFKMLLA